MICNRLSTGYYLALTWGRRSLHYFLTAGCILTENIFLWVWLTMKLSTLSTPYSQIILYLKFSWFSLLIKFCKPVDPSSFFPYLPLCTLKNSQAINFYFLFYFFTHTRKIKDIIIDDPWTRILGIEIPRDRPNRKMRYRQCGRFDNLLHQHLPNWEMPLEELPFTPKIERANLWARDIALGMIPCRPTETKIYTSNEGALS